MRDKETEHPNKQSPEKLSLEKNDLSVLSEEERIKAESFVNEDDREKYLLSHIYLRKILTFYRPHIDEGTWLFENNTYGKPEITAHQKNDLTLATDSCTHGYVDT